MSLPVQSPASGTPRRGPLRRYLETRGLLGGHASPRVAVRLAAADGTRLAGSLLHGRPAGAVAVLLVHGFAASHRKPAYARLADGLARVAPVLSIDLRGHGRSRGDCTFGDREVDDVLAGIAWLRRYGYAEVVAIGASMGATAVVAAAAAGAPIAGAVTISAPGWFRSPAPPGPLVRLERLWHSRLQRVAFRAATGVRVGRPSAWRDPAAPVHVVADVHCPLLVIHGDDDAYFPPADARALVAAAGGPATLWAYPMGFGHAEDGFDTRFVASLGDAVRRFTACGAFPPVPAHPPAGRSVFTLFPPA